MFSRAAKSAAAKCVMTRNDEDLPPTRSDCQENIQYVPLRLGRRILLGMQGAISAFSIRGTWRADYIPAKLPFNRCCGGNKKKYMGLQRFRLNRIVSQDRLKNTSSAVF
jgi:CRISPR/Cas system endoribonuclease Cas6 (RAMP superfamily)